MYSSEVLEFISSLNKVVEASVDEIKELWANQTFNGDRDQELICLGNISGMRMLMIEAKKLARKGNEEFQEGEE